MLNAQNHAQYEANNDRLEVISKRSWSTLKKVVLPHVCLELKHVTDLTRAILAARPSDEAGSLKRALVSADGSWQLAEFSDNHTYVVLDTKTGLPLMLLRSVRVVCLPRE
jgi:hypothetical protein